MEIVILGIEIDRKTIVVYIPDDNIPVKEDSTDTKDTRKNHNVLLPIHEHLDLAIYVNVEAEVSNVVFHKKVDVRMFYVLGMKWG